MITKVQKWGNSQGLRLARQVLEDAHISVGDDVEVDIKDDTILITRVKPVRGRVNLQELVSHMPEDYKSEEVDWGKIVGKEVW